MSVLPDLSHPADARRTVVVPLDRARRRGLRLIRTPIQHPGDPIPEPQRHAPTRYHLRFR